MQERYVVRRRGNNQSLTIPLQYKDAVAWMGRRFEEGYPKNWFYIEQVHITEPWMVICYNSLDSGFGFECGAFTVSNGWDKATAKSIARYKNKVAPDFCGYEAVEEPQRMW